MRKFIAVLIALTMMCAFSLPQIVFATGSKYTISDKQTGSSGETAPGTETKKPDQGTSGQTSDKKGGETASKNRSGSGNGSYKRRSKRYYQNYSTSNNKLQDGEVSIIFSGDIHSALDKYKISENGSVKSVGGLAYTAGRIKGINDEYNDSFVVDAGNFTTGNIFGTVTTGGFEMKVLGKAGYDAVNLGSDEFGLGTAKLAAMLGSAKNAISDWTIGRSADLKRNITGMPYVLMPNIDWSASTDDNARKLKRALDTYGAARYMLIEKENTKVAIFGIMDEAAVKEASNSGVSFSEYKEYARSVMDEINKEKPDMVIALAACASSEKIQDGAAALASAVPGIDVMVCSGTGEVTKQAGIKGTTAIVSAGENGRYLGHILMKKSGESYAVKQLKIYEIDKNVSKDYKTESAVESAITAVDNKIFKGFGMSYSTSLGTNRYDLGTIEELIASQNEEPLGDLIADAYLYQAARSGIKAKVAFFSPGEMKDTFYKGELTPADIYNSMNTNTTGHERGYELVRFYLSGAEIKNLAEIDASFSAADPDARLYFSGLSYSTNTHRLKYNRAADIAFADSAGKTSDIDDKALYCVVTDRYFAGKLGEILNAGLSLISIAPKDAKGIRLESSEYPVIKAGSVNAENWSAVSRYIMDKGISAYYGTTHNRKIANNSFSPVAVFKQANSFARIIYSIIIIPVVIIAGIILFIRQRAKARRGYSTSMFGGARRRTRRYKSKFR